METGLINNLTVYNKNIETLLADSQLNKQLIIIFDHLKFTATALVSGKFVSLEEFTFKIEQNEETILNRILNLSVLLNHDFDDIIYISQHQNSTVVPKDFYDAEYRNTYLNFTHKTVSNKDIISKSVEDKEVVFVLPLSIIDQILQKTPTAKIFHSVEYFLSNKSKNTLFLNKKNNIVEVALFDHSENLSLYNHYHYNTNNDIEYFKKVILSDVKEKVIVHDFNNTIIDNLYFKDNNIESYFKSNKFLYHLILFYANN